MSRRASLCCASEPSTYCAMRFALERELTFSSPRCVSIRSFENAGICLLAMLLACLRKRNKDRRRDEKVATLDMLNKRRPAPAVSLSVEQMAQPDSPDQVGYSCSIFYRRVVPKGQESGKESAFHETCIVFSSLCCCAACFCRSDAMKPEFFLLVTL